jgi:16S rRNA G1207 methylase RsmC
LEQQQALSEGARGSGEVLAQLTKQAEAERAAMDRAQLATAEADIAKKRAQEAEMQGLAEQLAQMETQRRMMITGAVTEPIAQSLGAASQMVMQQEIASRMSSAQVAAAAERQAAMDYYNMTQAMSNVGGTTVTPGGLPPGGIR